MSVIEVERKFLVASDRWRSEVRSSRKMCQGYLGDDPSCSVRVRIAGDQAWLNLKSVTVGAQRYEFEYEIPVGEGWQMLDLLGSGPRIEKTRYYIDFGGHLWEIDVFEGENAGLIVAEIELEHPDEPFDRPDWLGEEVTEDVRYYNTRLARNPYRHW